MKVMKVSRRYLIWFISILAMEIAIAVFHFHPFIRGFVGDVLIVPMLYVFLRAFFPLSKTSAALIAWIFACTIEFIQWLEITEKLDIRGRLIDLTLGNTFDPWDLLAYSLGYVLILLTEMAFNRIKNDA